MTFVEIFEWVELEKCISIAFKDDQKLIEEYHILGGTLEDCVRDTKLKIIEESDRITLDWYKVLDDYGLIIGFLVVSDTYKLLYSFGLNIDSREEYKKEFFDKVSSMFEGEFTCGLWGKNERAIRFLENMGMEVITQDENIKILKLCQ
jgi:hypothetical protein